MRIIDLDQVTDVVKQGLIKANYILTDDVSSGIFNACKNENSPLAKQILSILNDNIKISAEMKYPLCQDTGMAVVFCEIGQEIFFENGYLIDAINKGVEEAYSEGFLRKSVVSDPLRRVNTGNNLPAIIYTEIVKGDKLKITAMPKGFGAENQSALKMFVPSDTEDDIVDFIVNGVIGSSGKGCPPCVIGVGIGGSFEYSAFLSKKALLNNCQKRHSDPFYSSMEKKIIDGINKSGIGTLGMTGSETCLGVNILTYPTHIAGLPVAYNYCCHSCRHEVVII